MLIVTLPPEDWEAYRDLRLRALKEDPQAFGSSYADAVEHNEERWTGRLREALKGETSWLLFAREHGRLVGMIGAFVEDASPQTAIIISVYVPAEERGKGISSALMESMLETLSCQPSLSRAALTVNVPQLPAIALYRKFGFEPTGTRPSRTGGGEHVEEMDMERPLPYQPQPAGIIGRTGQGNIQTSPSAKDKPDGKTMEDPARDDDRSQEEIQGPY